jgi:hypothetical protein
MSFLYSFPISISYCFLHQIWDKKMTIVFHMSSLLLPAMNSCIHKNKSSIAYNIKSICHFYFSNEIRSSFIFIHFFCSHEKTTKDVLLHGLKHSCNEHLTSSARFKNPNHRRANKKGRACSCARLVLVWCSLFGLVIG